MQTIQLTETMRLHRIDSRNWVVQELREPAPDSGGRVASSREPKWFSTGNYFQTLGSALRFAWEWACRADGGEHLELAEAMRRAEGIAAEMTRHVDEALAGGER